jgi:hypothetical protein
MSPAFAPETISLDESLRSPSLISRSAEVSPVLNVRKALPLRRSRRTAQFGATSTFSRRSSTIDALAVMPVRSGVSPEGSTSTRTAYETTPLIVVDVGAMRSTLPLTCTPGSESSVTSTS